MDILQKYVDAALLRQSEAAPRAPAAAPVVAPVVMVWQGKVLTDRPRSPLAAQMASDGPRERIA